MSVIKLAFILILPAIVIGAGILPQDYPEVAEILAGNPRLSYLGEIGKKKLYFEPTRMSWENAENCCQNMGMTLVSVQNTKESDFLKNAGLGISVWTSGRDVGSRDQFRWGNGAKIGNPIEFAPFQKQSCLLFHYITGLNDRLCSATWPSVCEQVTRAGITV